MLGFISVGVISVVDWIICSCLWTSFCFSSIVYIGTRFYQCSGSGGLSDLDKFPGWLDDFYCRACFLLIRFSDGAEFSEMVDDPSSNELLARSGAFEFLLSCSFALIRPKNSVSAVVIVWFFFLLVWRVSMLDCFAVRVLSPLFVANPLCPPWTSGVVEHSPARCLKSLKNASKVRISAQNCTRHNHLVLRACMAH